MLTREKRMKMDETNERQRERETGRGREFERQTYVEESERSRMNWRETQQKYELTQY